jgi:hypothetical protein
MFGLPEGSFMIRATHGEARMRGDDERQAAMWSSVSPEERVPADHPVQPLRAMANTTLSELSPVFAKLYSPLGRPSIPAEKLRRAHLQQILYTL